MAAIIIFSGNLFILNLLARIKWGAFARERCMRKVIAVF